MKFVQLWANHPTNHGDEYPCRMLGFKTFREQSAIRMGVCLRRSGVALKEMLGATTCGHVTMTDHPDEDMHFVNAAELADVLRRSKIRGIDTGFRLSKPENFVQELGGRKGIIYFSGYWWRLTDITAPTGDHIDLWDGSRTPAGTGFPWSTWLDGATQASEIWFWEVK